MDLRRGGVNGGRDPRRRREAAEAGGGGSDAASDASAAAVAVVVAAAGAEAEEGAGASGCCCWCFCFCCCEAEFACFAPDGLKMILRTEDVGAVATATGVVASAANDDDDFLFLGRTPRGAMFSTTPYLISPSFSKLALACTAGSSHRCMKSREACVDAKGRNEVDVDVVSAAAAPAAAASLAPLPPFTGCAGLETREREARAAEEEPMTDGSFFSTSSSTFLGRVAGFFAPWAKGVERGGAAKAAPLQACKSVRKKGKRVMGEGVFFFFHILDSWGAA